jgi:hypothetical protein
VRPSVRWTKHVTLGGDVVLSASASARPSCPEPLASSAPMATLGPRARYLATGTVRAGVMGGARRRGRVYAKPGISDQVLYLHACTCALVAFFRTVCI